MSDIILTTFNARYSHCALGLRYLQANMGELASRTRLMEFIINTSVTLAAEKLLAAKPSIVGIGVYIWNVEESRQLVQILRTLQPELIIIAGGPEVSYEEQAQPWLAACDYVISGQADLAFAELCEPLLQGNRPAEKFLKPASPRLDAIHLPYDCYTDEDIAQRRIYVEASRGCPFKCEFCLSALDKTAWPFDLELFLTAMDRLYRRGARQFKFVDRTFNLKAESCRKILQFFLDRLDPELFLHFELIPDHLPESLKPLIQAFPPGQLQFEIGIQSFNPAVQTLISRRQNDAQAEENIRWLREQTHAHLHTDLIAGLPGETLASFAAGFDRLHALAPHEIQVGILKRLRGTPIIRHTSEYQLRFNPQPPYNILATAQMDFTTLQRISRFARYWDLIANSGRFRHTLPLILAGQPFERFMALSDYLFATSDTTHNIALRRLFTLLYEGVPRLFTVTQAEIEEALGRDYAANGLKGRPPFAPTTSNEARTVIPHQRQRQHLP